MYDVGGEEGAADRRRRSKSAIPQGYVPYIHIELGHSLICVTEYAVAETEEIFRMVLELSDSMPDKADSLDNCGAGFFRSFPDTNGKEDIDNCILASETALHLTPKGHAGMPGRLDNLGNSFKCRFQLATFPKRYYIN